MNAPLGGAVEKEQGVGPEEKRLIEENVLKSDDLSAHKGKSSV